jgi:hypothetical protein
MKRVVGLSLAGVTLLSVGLWLRWKENRWLSAPGNKDELIFSFWIEDFDESPYSWIPSPWLSGY